MRAFRPRERFTALRQAGVGCVTVTCGFWEGTLESLDQLGRWRDLIRENADVVATARTAADIRAIVASGRTALLMGYQNAELFQGRIRLVELFAELGVRCVQLTYNNQNSLGGSCYEDEDSGLARYGRQVIQEMNRCGMLVDLSHVGNRTTLDAIRFSKKPVAITHANPDSLFPHKRNKTDDVIAALRDNGGVIGCATYRNITGDEYCATVENWCEMVREDRRDRRHRPCRHRHRPQPQLHQARLRLDAHGPLDPRHRLWRGLGGETGQGRTARLVPDAARHGQNSGRSAQGRLFGHRGRQTDPRKLVAPVSRHLPQPQQLRGFSMTNAVKPRLLQPNRRLFLQGTAALAASTLAAPRLARAQSTELYINSWGGPWLEAAQANLFDPFTAATGIQIHTVSPVSFAKLAQQVATGVYEFDVTTLGGAELVRANQAGLLETIAEPYPGGLFENGAASHAFATMLAWRTDKGWAETPQSWADFWDVASPARAACNAIRPACCRWRCWLTAWRWRICIRWISTALLPSSTRSRIISASGGPPVRNRRRFCATARWT